MFAKFAFVIFKVQQKCKEKAANHFQKIGKGNLGLKILNRFLNKHKIFYTYHLVYLPIRRNFLPSHNNSWLDGTCPFPLSNAEKTINLYYNALGVGKKGIP